MATNPRPNPTNNAPETKADRMFDGPIPGANFTSDTRNYPWHRPPEHTDLNKAIEAAAKKITAPKASMGLLTLLKNGMDVSSLTYSFLMSGVGSGKWTVDYALLMAGPVAHIMCLMAKADDIEYELGLDEDYDGPTIAFFNGLEQISEQDATSAGKEALSQLDQVDMSGSTAQQPATGFMGGQPTSDPAPIEEI